jgi:hypothetical protein
MTVAKRMHAVEHAELGQQLQSPEDGRPADAALVPAQIFPDLLRTEVIVSAGDEVDDHPPGRGEAMPVLRERADNLGAGARSTRLGGARRFGPVIRVLHAVTHGGSILTMLATH